MYVLICLAVAPVCILLHAVYVADRYEREPIPNLLMYLLFGGLAVVPVFLLEQGLSGLRAKPFFGILIGVALVEEFGKWIALRYRARRDPELNEPFDWIVYAVSISLGFALVENIEYVLRYGYETGVMRAFTAVPAHALYGTLMGDRLARGWRRKGAEANVQFLWSIVEPTLWHAFYDLVAASDRQVLVFPLLVVLYSVAASRVRHQQLLARSGERLPPILLPDKVSLRLRARMKRRKAE